MTKRRRGVDGQASVEFALALPLVIIFILLMVQVGIVLVHGLSLNHAAREAARAAAVDPSSGSAAAAAQRATDLNPAKVGVSVQRDGGSRGMVTVVLTYESQIRFPLTDRVLLRPQLTAQAAMRMEAGQG